ncbi:hypothetical protein [Gordonia alkanivorans]|uniref:hypothetical protein n=1 Tax=Gordonia alkanivorans TaxID=84096 RepID=UPI0004B31F16|nr:hypothetical protein [Gordonia alkanivorans]
MTSAVSRFYPTLGEVGQLHQIHEARARRDDDLGVYWFDLTCTCRHKVSVPADGGTVDIDDTLRRHIHREWQKAHTITTPRDLDALPIGSVIDDHGAIGARAESAWYFVGCTAPYEPQLPVRLVRYGYGPTEHEA